MNIQIQSQISNPILVAICRNLILKDILNLRRVNPSLDCAFHILDENGEPHFFDSLSKKNILEYRQIQRQVAISLMRAIQIRDLKKIKTLLHREDLAINLKDRSGSTALMWAIDKGLTDVVKLLTQRRDLDVNSKNFYGDTALIRAVWEENLEMVQSLLARPELDINHKGEDGRTALYMARLKKNSKIISVLESDSRIKL